MQYFTYLVQDDVHVQLGVNLTNVFSVTIDNQEYWVSLYREDGFSRLGLRLAAVL